MAQAFNLTAQLQLQSPKNVNQVVNDIRRQLRPIGVRVNIQNTRNIAQANKGLASLSKNAKSSNKNVSDLNRTLQESARRFSVITIATGSFLALANAFKNSVKEAIAFERELVRISQVTGKSVSQLKGLYDEVTRLSTTLGTSSSDLLSVARTLSQAGFAADDTRKALDILAKTTLAATFDNIQDTTEGAIALLRQFGDEAESAGGDVQFLEQSLDAINAVSKRFAVESGDLISAIRRTGGVFSAAGGSINELIALFTSVRSTTRESAETIATGLRTIFTRIQRVETIDQLRTLGVELQDAQGNFVGAFEAFKRLSQGLKGLDPRSSTFSQIVEDLGGFRQVGKVIPLIQQFTTAQQALSVAQGASGSTARDAQIAQQSLGVQIQKVREEFDALIRKFADSSTFRSLAGGAIGLARAFVKIADSLEPLLPLLVGLLGLKLGQGIAPALAGLAGAGRRAGGFGTISKFATGGVVPGTGNRDTVPAMLTPGEFVIRKKSVESIGAENLAKMNSGGRVQKYAKGGEIKVEDGTIGQIAPTGTAGDRTSSLKTVKYEQVEKKYKNVIGLNKSGLKPKDTIDIKPVKVQDVTLDPKNKFAESKFFKNIAPKINGEIRRQLKAKIGSIGSFEPIQRDSKAKESLGGFAFERYAGAILGASPGGEETPLDFNVKDNKKLQNNTRIDPLPQFIDAKRSFVAPGQILDKALRDVRVEKQFDPKSAKTKGKGRKNALGGLIQKFAKGGGVEGKKRNAYIFDFDDTLATTEAKGFKEFSNPEFVKSASATRYASLAKRRASQGDDVHVLTARSGGGGIRQAIAQFMAENGIATKSVMAVGKAFPKDREPGKRPGTTRKISTAGKKAKILAKLAKNYNKITFLDDNAENLLQASKVRGVSAVEAAESKLFKNRKNLGGLIQKFGAGGTVAANELKIGDVLDSGQTVKGAIKSGNRQRRRMILTLDKDGSSKREEVDFYKKFGLKSRAKAPVPIKFATGGIVDQKAAGAAILDPVPPSSKSVTVSGEDMKKEFVEFKKLARGKDPVSKFYKSTSFDISKSGLNKETSNKFKVALEDGLISGVNTSTSILANDLGTPNAKIDQSQATNFVKGINTQVFGRLFETTVDSISRQGNYDKPDTNPNRPFDAEQGLPPVLKDNFKGLPNKFIDLKTSATAASDANLKGKVVDQIKRELIQDGILKADYPGKAGRDKDREKNLAKTEVEREKLRASGAGFPVKRNSGGAAPSDTVPALLTPGEFVFNKKAADSIGRTNLDRMNKQGVQGFAKGGSVGVQRFQLGGEPSSIPLGTNTGALGDLVAAGKSLSQAADDLSNSADDISDAADDVSDSADDVSDAADDVSDAADDDSGDDTRTNRQQTDGPSRFQANIQRIDAVASAAQQFVFLGGAVSALAGQFSSASDVTKTAINRTVGELTGLIGITGTVVQVFTSLASAAAERITSESINSATVRADTVVEAENTATVAADSVVEARNTAVVTADTIAESANTGSQGAGALVGLFSTLFNPVTLVIGGLIALVAVFSFARNKIKAENEALAKSAKDLADKFNKTGEGFEQTRGALIDVVDAAQKTARADFLKGFLKILASGGSSAGFASGGPDLAKGFALYADAMGTFESFGEEITSALKAFQALKETIDGQNKAYDQISNSVFDASVKLNKLSDILTENIGELEAVRIGTETSRKFSDIGAVDLTGTFKDLTEFEEALANPAEYSNKSLVPSLILLKQETDRLSEAQEFAAENVKKATNLFNQSLGNVKNKTDVGDLSKFVNPTTDPRLAPNLNLSTKKADNDVEKSFKLLANSLRQEAKFRILQLEIQKQAVGQDTKLGREIGAQQREIQETTAETIESNKTYAEEVGAIAERRSVTEAINRETKARNKGVEALEKFNDKISKVETLLVKSRGDDPSSLSSLGPKFARFLGEEVARRQTSRENLRSAATGSSPAEINSFANLSGDVSGLQSKRAKLISDQKKKKLNDDELDINKRKIAQIDNELTRLSQQERLENSLFSAMEANIALIEKERRAREQVLGVLEDFVVGGVDTRNNLAEAARGVQFAFSTGTLQNQSEEQRRSTVGLLDKLSDVRLSGPFASVTGDIKQGTGKDIKQELVIRDAIRMGLDLDTAKQIAEATSAEEKLIETNEFLGRQIIDLTAQMKLATDAINENMASDNPPAGAVTAATGGLVQYRSGGGSIFKPKGTDTVPAMLTAGEYVIKKSAVDQIGVDNLQALNNGGAVNYLGRGGQGEKKKKDEQAQERGAANALKGINDLESRGRGQAIGTNLNRIDEITSEGYSPENEKRINQLIEDSEEFASGSGDFIINSPERMEQIAQNRQRRGDILVDSTAEDTGYYDNLLRFGPTGRQFEKQGGRVQLQSEDPGRDPFDRMRADGIEVLNNIPTNSYPTAPGNQAVGKIDDKAKALVRQREQERADRNITPFGNTDALTTDERARIALDDVDRSNRGIGTLRRGRSRDSFSGRPVSGYIGERGRSALEEARLDVYYGVNTGQEERENRPGSRAVTGPTSRPPRRSVDLGTKFGPGVDTDGDGKISDEEQRAVDLRASERRAERGGYSAPSRSSSVSGTYKVTGGPYAGTYGSKEIYDEYVEKEKARGNNLKSKSSTPSIGRQKKTSSYRVKDAPYPGTYGSKTIYEEYVKKEEARRKRLGLDPLVSSSTPSVAPPATPSVAPPATPSVAPPATPPVSIPGGNFRVADTASIGDKGKTETPIGQRNRIQSEGASGPGDIFDSFVTDPLKSLALSAYFNGAKAIEAVTSAPGAIRDTVEPIFQAGVSGVADTEIPTAVGMAKSAIDSITESVVGGVAENVVSGVITDVVNSSRERGEPDAVPVEQSSRGSVFSKDSSPSASRYEREEQRAFKRGGYRARRRKRLTGKDTYTFPGSRTTSDGRSASKTLSLSSGQLPKGLDNAEELQQAIDRGQPEKNYRGNTLRERQDKRFGPDTFKQQDIERRGKYTRSSDFEGPPTQDQFNQEQSKKDLAKYQRILRTQGQGAAARFASTANIEDQVGSGIGIGGGAVNFLSSYGGGGGGFGGPQSVPFGFIPGSPYNQSLGRGGYGIPQFDPRLLFGNVYGANPYGGFFASGGSVGEDTIPAMLTPGEFVMNADSVKKYGTSFMSQVNKGNLPGFNNGGTVGGVQYRQGGGLLSALGQGASALGFDTSKIQGVFDSFVGNISSVFDNISTPLDNVVQSLNQLAQSFGNFEMQHTVNVDGLITIGGLNIEFISDMISESVSTLVGEEIKRAMDNKQKGFNSN